MPTNRPTTVRRTPEYLGPAIDIDVSDLLIYESRGYIIQPKVDGMWASCTVGESGNIFNSRDARTPSLSDNKVNGLLQLKIPLRPGTILIGELEAATEWATEQYKRNGFRRFYPFDIIREGNRDLRGWEWQRRNLLLEAKWRKFSSYLKERMPWVPSFGHGFVGLYHKWIKDGFEGAVCKDPSSTYQTARMDGKTDNWVRCKRWLTGDFVYCGEALTDGGAYGKPKLTGTWGLFKGDKLVSVMQAGAPENLLKRKNIGKLVAEFKGWAKGRSGALRHAQFVRVREDKQPGECVL